MEMSGGEGRGIVGGDEGFMDGRMRLIEGCVVRWWEWEETGEEREKGRGRWRGRRRGRSGEVSGAGVRGRYKGAEGVS